MAMIESGLLKSLRCPETRQALRAADADEIEKLNQQIAAGTLRNRAGRPVKEKLGAGLVRSDGEFLYPIAQNVPVMLVEEAIPLLSAVPPEVG